jgi:hypothetical protein
MRHVSLFIVKFLLSRTDPVHTIGYLDFVLVTCSNVLINDDRDLFPIMNNIIFAYLLVVPALVNNSQPHHSWPVIAPYSEVFTFTDGEFANASVILKGKDGHPLYRLECHTFSYSDPDFDYSGDFECRLVSLYSKEPWSTLLTDEPQQSRDWQSRGRFLASELEGACDKYPEYGAVRHFRLRGMQLTLEISDFKLVSKEIAKSQSGDPIPRFQSFRLHIKATPDTSAASEIAERPAAPESPCAYGQQSPLH